MDDIVESAVNAAMEAGEAILNIYQGDFEVELKEDQSPLTAADRASHEVIAAALASTAYPVVSEEGAETAYEQRKNWNTYWLIDPLDGTKEFVNQNGEFTVNIALVEAGVPVVGVVYVPVTDTLYVGVVNGVPGMAAGAWKALGCRGKSFDAIMESAEECRVAGTSRGALKVVASKSHFNEETEQFITALEMKFGPPEFVSRGSSLKLCMIADGSADLYPRIAPTMEWDTAAAHAVVTAAGGAVFQYVPSHPPDSYVVGRSDCDVLTYNKENLLNPFFVVSGLVDPERNP